MIHLRSSFLRTAALSSILFFSWQAFAGEYIVKIKKTANFSDSVSDFKSSATELSQTLSIKDTHTQGDLILISTGKASQKSDDELLKKIKLRSDVEYVVPNVTFRAFEEQPNDTQYSQQWALKKVAAEKAWTMNKGDKKVVVAVIDTGSAWGHEDLKQNIWSNPRETVNGIDDDQNGFVDDVRGWDFRDNDADPNDETGSANPGHGTHCSGIVGAVGNNGIGISGISPSVSIMPVRFLGADGSGDLMTAAKAIDYANNNGAQVISASWGAAVPRDQVTPILEAIERANQKGIVFVVAAANDGKSNDITEVYPANAGLTNVISVAASDPDDKKPQWSNFGKHKVDLAAPGLNILSTLPGNKYGNLSGTSMATPLVSGMVALMIAEASVDNRQLSPAAIKAILQATGTKVEIETACNCRIAADLALESIKNNSLTVVPNALSIDINKTQKFQAIGGEGAYTFSSSSPEIADIAADGTLTTKTKGVVQILVKDASGHTASTKDVLVGPTNEGGGGGACPFQNPIICAIICQIDATLPWCH